MHKKISVVLAAALLITVGLPRRFMPGGQADVYETVLMDTSGADQEEAASAPEAGEESAADGTEGTGTEEGIAIEESGEGESVPESVEGLEEEPEAITPGNAEGSIAGFTAFSTNEAVVTNYTELKSALANDNGITTVYFGDNITMQGGIAINSKKINVIIDGFNPFDPEQLQPYTLTDLDSSSFYDTIYIDATGTTSLLVRDLTITGKNYYGPFSIYDSSSLAGIAVTYERVDYNGPQLGYHRKGGLYIKDCTVRIHGGNGTKCASNEFSEAKYLTFEGANTIDSATSAHSVFWVPYGGSLQIADDSSLVVTSPDTSATYGVFYADGSSNKVDITIGNRAVLGATISSIVAPDAYVTLNSLTVREGGAFYLRTTKTATGSVLRMGGALTVEKDAKFILSGYGGASYTLLRQESGDITVGKDAIFQITADSAYTTLLNLIGRAFICDDPASILLYNANRDILATTSAGRVYVNAQQVNYWNTLSPGGLDNPPLYRWDKADKTNLLLDGTLTAGASGNFSSISSNYTAGDPPGAAPNATTFSMVNARVLSFGRLELIVAEPTIRSTSIGGVTAPGAAVRVLLTQQGVNYTFPDVTADSEGLFHVPIDMALDHSASITVQSNWQYLTATAEAVVNGEGVLELFVPDVLEFFNSELTSSIKTIKRLNPDWKIVVSDTRGADGGWSIYARLGSEMTSNSLNWPALTGALVFADDFGNTTVMSKDAETLIVKHTSVDDEEIIPVAWDNDKGVLLVVKPGAVSADTLYTATIIWTIINGV